MQCSLRNVSIKDTFKAVRLTRMLLFGGFVYAPIAVTWYNVLGAIVPGQSASAVLFKVPY